MLLLECAILLIYSGQQGCCKEHKAALIPLTSESPGNLFPKPNCHEHGIARLFTTILQSLNSLDSTNAKR